MFLLIGQLSDLSAADFKLNLSFFSNTHSNNRWSIVWSLSPQGHVGVFIILNRCRYDLMFPCPVTMLVKFWVGFMLCVESFCNCREGSGEHSCLSMKYVEEIQIGVESGTSFGQFTRRPNYVLLLLGTLNCHKSVVFE